MDLSVKSGGPFEGLLSGMQYPIFIVFHGRTNVWSLNILYTLREHRYIMNRATTPNDLADVVAGVHSGRVSCGYACCGTGAQTLRVHCFEFRQLDGLGLVKCELGLSPG